MGSVATSSLALPDIESLSALFPSTSQSPEYSVAYVYAGVTLLALGEEKRMPELWQQISETHASNEAAQVTAASRLREGLVKASPLLGFPRAINALTLLRTAIQDASPPSVISALSPPPPSQPPNTSCSTSPLCCSSSSSSPKQSRPEDRGQALFSLIYGQHAPRVRANLDAISGGALLGAFAVQCIYGELLAETRVLDARESAALVFVACLAARAGPQAKGHMYGARNLGNSGEEIRAAVELVRRVAEGLGVRFNFEGMEFVEKVKDW